MGLANMALIQNVESGHGDEVDREFFRKVLNEGMRAALAFRQTDSDSTIAQV
jgi:hypothetical protein